MNDDSLLSLSPRQARKEQATITTRTCTSKATHTCNRKRRRRTSSLLDNSNNVYDYGGEGEGVLGFIGSPRTLRTRCRPTVSSDTATKNNTTVGGGTCSSLVVYKQSRCDPNQSDSILTLFDNDACQTSIDTGSSTKDNSMLMWVSVYDTTSTLTTARTSSICESVKKKKRKCKSIPKQHTALDSSSISSIHNTVTDADTADTADTANNCTKSVSVSVSTTSKESKPRRSSTTTSSSSSCSNDTTKNLISHNVNHLSPLSFTRRNRYNPPIPITTPINTSKPECEHESKSLPMNVTGIVNESKIPVTNEATENIKNRNTSIIINEKKDICKDNQEQTISTTTSCIEKGDSCSNNRSTGRKKQQHTNNIHNKLEKHSITKTNADKTATANAIDMATVTTTTSSNVIQNDTIMKSITAINKEKATMICSSPTSRITRSMNSSNIQNTTTNHNTPNNRNSNTNQKKKKMKKEMKIYVEYPLFFDDDVLSSCNTSSVFDNNNDEANGKDCDVDDNHDKSNDDLNLDDHHQPHNVQKKQTTTTTTTTANATTGSISSSSSLLSSIQKKKKNKIKEEMKTKQKIPKRKKTIGNMRHISRVRKSLVFVNGRYKSKGRPKKNSNNDCNNHHRGVIIETHTKSQLEQLPIINDDDNNNDNDDQYDIHQSSNTCTLSSLQHLPTPTPSPPRPRPQPSSLIQPKQHFIGIKPNSTRISKAKKNEKESRVSLTQRLNPNFVSILSSKSKQLLDRKSFHSSPRLLSSSSSASSCSRALILPNVTPTTPSSSSSSSKPYFRRSIPMERKQQFGRLEYSNNSTTSTSMSLHSFALEYIQNTKIKPWQNLLYKIQNHDTRTNFTTSDLEQLCGDNDDDDDDYPSMLSMAKEILNQYNSNCYTNNHNINRQKKQSTGSNELVVMKKKPIIMDSLATPTRARRTNPISLLSKKQVHNDKDNSYIHQRKSARKCIDFNQLCSHNNERTIEDVGRGGVISSQRTSSSYATPSRNNSYYNNSADDEVPPKMDDMKSTRPRSLSNHSSKSPEAVVDTCRKKTPTLSLNGNTWLELKLDSTSSSEEEDGDDDESVGRINTYFKGQSNNMKNRCVRKIRLVESDESDVDNDKNKESNNHDHDEDIRGVKGRLISCEVDSLQFLGI